MPTDFYKMKEGNLLSTMWNGFSLRPKMPGKFSVFLIDK